MAWSLLTLTFPHGGFGWRKTRAIGIRSIKHGDVAHGLHQFRTRRGGDLLHHALLFFPILPGNADFDEFVCDKCAFDFSLDGFGQTVLTKQYDGVEVVGLGAQILFLFTGESHAYLAGEKWEEDRGANGNKGERASLNKVCEITHCDECPMEGILTV